VQRLSAARRLGAGAVDRRVALAGFALVAIGLVVAVAFARAPRPDVPTPVPGISVRDPAAARDLVGLMRKGERGKWIVQYGFTRTTSGGRVLRQRGEEGRSGEWHVVVTGTAMTLEHGDKSSECDRAGDEYGCRAIPGGRALPESAVVRVVVDSGAYNVVRRPDTTIAGIRARCFRMRATGQGSLPEFGVETVRCLSRDGIPLRRVVARPPGNVEEHVATSVRADVTPAQVKALARARESGARESTRVQR
jgi:hypothetical protein